MGSSFPSVCFSEYGFVLVFVAWLVACAWQYESGILVQIFVPSQSWHDQQLNVLCGAMRCSAVLDDAMSIAESATLQAVLRPP